MNSSINELVKTFLQKESLQQCSEQELQQLSFNHPYFVASPLLLAQKLKMADKETFPAQLQNTYLFFYNPLQLDHLLNEKGNAVTERKKQDEKIEVVAVNAVETSLVQDENNHPGSYNQLPAFHLTPEIEEVPPATEQLPQLIPVTAEEPVLTETVPPINENTEPAMEIPSLRIEPIDPATTEFSFQPYHTVDYFASQGIKARDEEKPKDKFGQQLRSFTEWLKTIKKTSTPEITVTSTPNAEQKVEQLAQHSLSEPEVITEAMAAVWEKQGNREKAIRIYDKLSLLNPSKRSYFAAKIEQLKNS